MLFQRFVSSMSHKISIGDSQPDDFCKTSARGVRLIRPAALGVLSGLVVLVLLQSKTQDAGHRAAQKANGKNVGPCAAISVPHMSQ